MIRISLPLITLLATTWSSLAMAECEVPPLDASDTEIAKLIACMQAAGKTEDTARNDMIGRLRDLYKLLNGADEKRLDDSQRDWLAGTEQMCPDQTNDEGTIAIEASACRAARYTQRSALFDEIIAGCRAGACPVDKL